MSVDLLATLRDRRSRPVLVPPAPGPLELRELMSAAASAPDHGRLRPWRLVVVEGAALPALGDAFAAAHAERDPGASDLDLARARAKARRAPLIVVVVAAPRAHPKVPVREQRATAACVAYGLVLGAHARGYGAMWRTGWYGDSPKVRVHLGLSDAEEVTGWIYIGTPSGTAPPPRVDSPPPVTWLG